MADYTFQQVLVWDILPGGTVRTLRNGTVTVKNAADDSTLFNVTSDANGLATFTTTDVATVYLVSPNGLVSEHITAGSILEAAAAAALNNDAGVASFVNDTGSATRAALNSTYETGAGRIIYVSPSGNDSRNGKTWGTAKATIAAALTAMGTSRGTIVLDNGTHDVGAGSAWTSTTTCGLVGQGPGNTTIYASAQTGPVLDLTAADYNAIPNGLNDSTFGGFTLKGDGTAGAAKKGLALNPTVSLVRGHFHDITVTNTGGACFDLGYAELCDFDRFIAYEPVSASANDTPYLTAAGAFNGNRINSLMLNGISAGASVGVSGAVVIKDNGSTAPHDNKIAAPMVEFLHVPTGGTIFGIKGNANVIGDLQMFDSGKVSGATGTSHIRFDPPSVGDSGGNLVRGIIPGKGTNATDMDMGIDMRQSKNAVEGVKGYKGTNVVIAATVGFCHIRLGGGISGASDPGVVDNSGVLTNTITDAYSALTRRGAQEFQQGTARLGQDQPGGAWAGGVRFYDPATPTNGLVGLGTTGTRLSATGASATLTADDLTIRKIDLTPNVTVKFGAGGPRIFIGTGSPEGVTVAAVGSVFLRTDGGAASTFYVKESGTSNTGWVAK